MKTFKEDLITYLKRTGKLPSHLAREAGLSPAILSLFLSGKRGITLATAEKLKAVMKG